MSRVKFGSKLFNVVLNVMTDNEESRNNESFIYLLPSNIPNHDNNISFEYAPFILGPKSTPLKNELIITYEGKNTQLEIG